MLPFYISLAALLAISTLLLLANWDKWFNQKGKTTRPAHPLRRSHFGQFTARRPFAQKQQLGSWFTRWLLKRKERRLRKVRLTRKERRHLSRQLLKLRIKQTYGSPFSTRAAYRKQLRRQLKAGGAA